MKSNAKGQARGVSTRQKSPQKQGGGTFLGIVIGLVVGLAIAVVVAIMITKASTPFTNKLGLTKSSDAPQVQLTDPNKPLYGNAAKDVMANVNRAVDPATATAVAPADNAAPVNAPMARSPDSAKVDAKPPVRPDAKPDVKNTKVAEAGAADPVGQAYYLQVGAFRDASDAESSRAKLALIGVESRISTADGDNLYRVRIGPFDRLDTLNSMRSKLSENSIDVAVIKTPK